MLNKSFLWWCLIIGIISHFLFFILSKKEVYFTPYNAIEMGRLYSESQYVKGDASEGGIGDDGLYAFAGYYYLLDGGDVSSVNFEHPPLGKYLIGLSILLFQNQNIINLIYYVWLLFYTYRIGYLILRNSLLTLIPLFILSFYPLLQDHLLHSMLDLPFTLFFTAAIYYFLIEHTGTRYYTLSNLSWGAAFATRFFPFLIGIIFLLTLYLWFCHRQRIKAYCFSLLLIPFVYALSHMSFFVYRQSFSEFIAHKRWMVAWYRGAPVIMGNVWRNIFTGYYIGPSGELTHNKHWYIGLPLVVLLGITSFRQSMIRQKDSSALMIFVVCAAYLGYITLLTYGVTKYVMHIYPLLAVLAVWHAQSLYCSIMNQRNGDRPTATHSRKTH